MKNTRPERRGTAFVAEKQREILALEFFGGDETFDRFSADFDGQLSQFQARVFTVQATKSTYRLLHTWDKAGLLEPLGGRKRPGRGWRRFSVYDLMRLKVFFALRGFGASLSMLQTVNVELSIRNLRDGDALEKREERQDQLLHYLWIYAALGRNPILAVFADGKIGVGMRDQYLAAMDQRSWPSHIALPLTQLLLQTLPGATAAEHPSYSAVVSPEEWHLLSLIRSGRYDSVSVVTKDGRPKLLKIKESASLATRSKKEERRFLEKLEQSRSDFEQLQVSTNNGHMTHVRRTRSIKP